ncbi:MAG: hypothetical protein NC093_04985 [Alistipes sp.]|nr:hypothetical protein [Alistipes sp.]
MGIRIPWDKYEAVILHDAWLQVKSGVPKLQMVNLVSYQLRTKAVNQGFEIDDIFRNTNGISFQLMSMATAIEQKDMGKAASKLFSEIANLYRTDYNTYHNLKEEAMKMVEYSSKSKDAFIEYVYKKSADNAADIISAIDAMINFAISIKALSHSIYDDLTIDVISVLRKKSLSHKFFIVKYKKILSFAEIGLQMLEEYVKRLSVFHVDKNNTDNVNEKKGTEHNSDFTEWMMENASLKQATARSYKSAIDTCDQYGHNNKLYSSSIITCVSYEEFETLYKVLMNDRGFRTLSEEKHNYLVAALNKYRDYMLAKTNSSVSLPRQAKESNVSNEIKEKYGTLLLQEFEDGYCIGDYMHRMRFQSAYEERYGEELGKTADETEEIFKSIGQVRDERIFYSDKSNYTVLSDIYDSIWSAFDSGATAVYYECLYNRYTDRLAAEMSIYSVDTLRTVIQGDTDFPKKYRAMKSFIAKYGIEADSNEEIRKVLQSYHIPVSIEEIQGKLNHIPMYKIRQALVQIPDAAYIEEGTYFYAPNFYISAEEKIALIRAMRSTISAKCFLVAKDLRDIFREACPSSAMDSEQYKDYSIRNILKVLLRDEFEFSSSVITEKGNQLDYGQVFRNYAADRERVTLNELLELKKELGLPVIYWDDVFKEMIRISDTEMVRKGTVQFDTAAVDRVLEEMYPDEYTPLKDITLFLNLPPTSVRWNGFLLESFLREYSEKFQLVQLSIAQDDYYGVMLKCSSPLKNYADVAADMLARNYDWSDEKSALQLLKKMNFQQRAKNTSISAIIKTAKQKRLNIE